MSTHHHPHNIVETSFKKLLFIIILNLIITITEIIGGFLSGSLSLLSDAVHNLGDTVSLVLSTIAIAFSRKKANNTFTFGYKRAEILASFFNAGSLLIIVILLVKKAIIKLYNPYIIDTKLMFIVAIVGLFGNLFSVIVLHKEKDKTLNLRSAYLHLFTDTLSSVVVILGAVFMYFYKLYYIDSILSIIIALYILKETWTVFIEAFKILMEYVPKEFNIVALKNDLLKMDKVLDIHDIHVWSLSENEVLFEAHVLVDENTSVKETELIRKRIQEYLNKKHIKHITLQFETDMNHDTCN